jgi:Flp pilus assembly protein TadD
MGNHHIALDYLQRAYEKQPENEIAAHLAEVLWVSGKKDDAKKLIVNALDNAPDDPYLLGFKNKFLQLDSSK